MADKKVDSLETLFDDKAMFPHMGGSWGKTQELATIKSGGIWRKRDSILLPSKRERSMSTRTRTPSTKVHCKLLVEDVIGVIVEIFLMRPVDGLRRLSNRLSMEAVVFLTIVKLFPNTGTYENLAVCRVDGDVSVVEESVEIAAYQNAVGDLVVLQHQIWLDVGMA